MHIPTSFDDDALLNDEPFCTYFDSRKMAGNTRSSKGWPEMIASGLRQDESALQAAQAWLDIAFENSTREGDAENTRKIFVDDDNALHLFIEFYWNRSMGRPYDAMTALHHERKRRGYIWTWGKQTVAVASGASQHTHEQESEGAKRLSDKQNKTAKRGRRRQPVAEDSYAADVEPESDAGDDERVPTAQSTDVIVDTPAARTPPPFTSVSASPTLRIGSDEEKEDDVYFSPPSEEVELRYPSFSGDQSFDLDLFEDSSLTPLDSDHGSSPLSPSRTLTSTPCKGKATGSKPSSIENSPSRYHARLSVDDHPQSPIDALDIEVLLPVSDLNALGSDVPVGKRAHSGANTSPTRILPRRAASNLERISECAAGDALYRKISWERDLEEITESTICPVNTLMKSPKKNKKRSAAAVSAQMVEEVAVPPIAVPAAVGPESMETATEPVTQAFTSAQLDAEAAQVQGIYFPSLLISVQAERPTFLSDETTSLPRASLPKSPKKTKAKKPRILTDSTVSGGTETIAQQKGKRSKRKRKVDADPTPGGLPEQNIESSLSRPTTQPEVKDHRRTRQSKRLLEAQNIQPREDAESTVDGPPVRKTTSVAHAVHEQEMQDEPPPKRRRTRSSHVPVDEPRPNDAISRKKQKQSKSCRSSDKSGLPSHPGVLAPASTLAQTDPCFEGHNEMSDTCAMAPTPIIPFENTLPAPVASSQPNTEARSRRVQPKRGARKDLTRFPAGPPNNTSISFVAPTMQPPSYNPHVPESISAPVTRKRKRDDRPQFATAPPENAPLSGRVSKKAKVTVKKPNMQAKSARPSAGNYSKPRNTRSAVRQTSASVPVRRQHVNVEECEWEPDIDDAYASEGSWHAEEQSVVYRAKSKTKTKAKAKAKSKLLAYATSVNAHKPALSTSPPIWSESRQELCESFDWFRSYQGGVYTIHDVAKGYLLSAFSSRGGKAEAVHSNRGLPEIVNASDQLAEDKSVKALLNNWKTGRPLVLLADDRYALFPYNLAAGHYTYVVLGFYQIVHAWAEYQPAPSGQGLVVRYKFAFHWCDEQGEDPWWCRQSDTEEPITENPTAEDPIESEQMPSLPQPPEVSETLLKSLLERPDPLNGGSPSQESLEYDEEFLRFKVQTESVESLKDLRPAMPPALRQGKARSKWECWECKFCGLVLKVTGQIRSHKDFWHHLRDYKFSHHRISDISGITIPPMSTCELENNTQLCQFHTYILPENRGKIYLILGHVRINKEADEIFQLYQEQARDGQLKFRRFPLKNHKCDFLCLPFWVITDIRILGRGQLLTNYFSHNSGAPYQYVGSTDNTVPLESACTAVLKSLDLIERRASRVLNSDTHFNEILSAAYMEKQSMSFHSDSERGLGPVVASLSLGSAALMHFRLLSKYLKPTAAKTQRKPDLTITLRHGDILVMEGVDVQKYYEHTVIPVNFRIAATARLISSENYSSPL
ncbi:hypothetical protein EW146_g4864 [Bondarzewia mesenterica]|uniref:C2H2-type domain-containing protein n=1 Tax=Bondarzewia mesenterica TaxID=1095465 RepID=A0A4S4LT94_9AGAM|nr:hypothetical protein EW146_g4864 [Bondarzewia mesenterica]